MGIYMSSYAMIGVKFTPTVKTEKVKKRGCEHPVKEAKFCSLCGKKMWNKETDTIHQFEYIDEDLLEPVGDKLEECFGGFVVSTRDFDAEHYYIGYGTDVDEHEDAQIPLIDPDEVKNKLKEILEEFGVWDQCKDSFGFWLISTGW